ncbi:unnamed protein product [Alopecurus aequalis]
MLARWVFENTNAVHVNLDICQALQEGIKLVFEQWTALQMAVENESGGRESRAKADQFAESILSWFTNSKGPFYYDDLEDMMFDSISESLNADFEDGSIEEVAGKLIKMHQECLQNNYSSIEKLRNTRPHGNVVSQSRQIATEDDDESSDDDDETSMGEDDATRSEDMVVDEPKPSKPTPRADGWSVVPPRRGQSNN